MSKNRVDILIAAQDHASRPMNRVAKSTRAMSAVVKSAAMGIAGYFGIHTAVSIFKFAVNYEYQMSRVKAITQANSEQFRLLNAAAQHLGKTTVFTAQQVAEAMTYLAMAGFSVNEIIKSMPAALDLAAAGAVDLATAANITAQIMRGMGLDAQELGYATDMLTKAFITANTDLAMLGEAMQYVGPVARGLGMDLTEVVSAIQMMSNAGVQASMAGTSLRGILTALSHGTPAAAEGLRKLGIETMTAEGNLRPLTDIVDQFNARLATMGKAEGMAAIMQIFGKRAGPGFAAILNEGSAALTQYQTLLANATGTARAMADEQLNNVKGTLVKIQSLTSGWVVSMFTQTSGFWKEFWDGMLYGLQLAEAVFTNLDRVGSWAWNSIALSAVNFYEDTKYFFTDQLPAYLKWFGQNWTNLFVTAWNFTSTVTSNMWTNLSNFFVAVWEKLKGNEFNFEWTGLLEGFESTLSKLPEIAERSATDLELALYQKIQDADMWGLLANAGKTPAMQLPAGGGAPAPGAMGPAADLPEMKTKGAAAGGGSNVFESLLMSGAPGRAADYNKETANQTKRLNQKFDRMNRNMERFLRMSGQRIAPAATAMR